MEIIQLNTRKFKNELGSKNWIFSKKKGTENYLY